VVLIGMHGVGSAFLQCNFPKRTLIGSFILPEIAMKNSLLGSLENEFVCGIYTIEDHTSLVVVICQYEVSAERAYSWTSSLFYHLKPERICVFDSILDSKYIAPDESVPFNFPLLRQLATRAERSKNEQGKQICPSLEAPNFVDKAPAAILQYCERRNIRSILFLSLEDSQQLEPLTLQAFEQVLPHLGIEIPHTNNKYNQTVENIRRNNPVFL